MFTAATDEPTRALFVGLTKKMENFISHIKVQSGYSWLVGAAVLHVSIQGSRLTEPLPVWTSPSQ